jgi:DNA polymerase III alpha subunit (gram-positive type)
METKIGRYNYIIFDFETGGLDSTLNPITEIGMMLVNGDNLKEINKWESYIKPYNNLTLEKRALEITMITETQLNKGLDIKQMVDTFCILAKSITPKGDKGQKRPTLVGHNVAFDISFLQYAFKLCGKNLEDYVHSNQKEITAIDTMKLAQQAWNDEKSNLAYCCKKIGIDHVDAHRAMNDVVVTWKLWSYFVRAMRGSNTTTKGSVITVEENKTQEFRNTFQF